MADREQDFEANFSIRCRMSAHEAPGFTLMLEARDDVIGAAPDDDLTLSMALLPSVCPKAIDVMEDLLDFDRGNVRTAANSQVLLAGNEPEITLQPVA